MSEQPNPAKIAAQEAMAQLEECIETNQSFILEAGAGAGKTYSLISALKILLERRGVTLLRNHQQIACITYTNVAKDEIEARTDSHPAIRSDTIHGFSWSLLKGFQPFLRAQLPHVGKWAERIVEGCELQSQRVDYDLGYPRIDHETVSLGHNDILELMVRCLDAPKFRRALTAKFPILFIDEYQDTDADIVEALKRSFLDTGEGPLIGFFGDEWQKIYGDGCGKISHPRLRVIGKRANFRSTNAIVEPLNKIRPDLPQVVSDPDAIGSATIFHANAWTGPRQTSAHWKGDVTPEAAHKYLRFTMSALEKADWDFNKTKILMLTHNLLAKEQGYPGVAAAFSNNEAFVKKEDPHIAYLVDVIEPACEAFQSKNYGAMFEAFGRSAPPISSFKAKVEWVEAMTKLMDLRGKGTIGDVMDYLRRSKLLRLPEKVEEREKALLAAPQEDEPSWLGKLRNLRLVPYREIIELDRYIDGRSPFATKHGVKGAEFENVLVVVGRGWNQYNFEQMLCWFADGVPAGKGETFVRNRNLFYVAISRPRRRLAVLFTQQLSQTALKVLEGWFGVDAIQALPDL